MSNSQQMEFLDGIEADLASPSAEVTRRARSGRAARVLGGAMLASAATMGLFGGVASAAQASPASVQSCASPDPVAQTQSKWCGTANYVFVYQYTYSPNGGIVRCYVFDETIYNGPCGGVTYIGRKEACA
ncbi:hypothetical protein ACWEVP_16995 [Amycolatopsis sp. NPDC003865]